MRRPPSFPSFVVAALCLCAAIWAIGRHVSEGEHVRAVVVSDDGSRSCFHVLDDADASERSVRTPNGDVCIENVSEPLTVGDCVTLRQGFPGLVVAGRANCVLR